MSRIISCPIKLNLSLRVLGKNHGELHEIFTIFLRIKGEEGLTIATQIKENIMDSIDISGAQISGVNSITRVLSLARGKCAAIPPMRVAVNKKYPTGSGIGAGSGNAAAALVWLRERYGFAATYEEIAKLGADMAFLASPYSLALARGVGDVLTPLDDIAGICVLLIFPHWRSETKYAYERLDRLREEKKAETATVEECGIEARRLLAALSSKEKVGLLPNDFLEIFSGELRADYDGAFALCRDAGAFAWGLSGSGSAIFALFSEESAVENADNKIKALNWVQKTAKLG